jgi:hypothetical protein
MNSLQDEFSKMANIDSSSMRSVSSPLHGGPRRVGVAESIKVSLGLTASLAADARTKDSRQSKDDAAGPV